MKFPKVLDNSKNVRQGGKKIEKAISKMGDINPTTAITALSVN